MRGPLAILLLVCAGARTCVSPDPQDAGAEPAGFQKWQVKAFVAHGPRIFRERAAASPLDQSSYIMGSQACAVQGDFPGAIAFLERGIEFLPDAPGQMFFNLGQLHVRVGNLSAARKRFAEGVRRDPTQPNYMEMLALLEEHFGDDDVGERLYKTAARYGEVIRAFRTNYLSLLLRHGRFKEVSSLLSRMLNYTKLYTPTHSHTHTHTYTHVRRQLNYFGR